MTHCFQCRVHLVSDLALLQLVLAPESTVSPNFNSLGLNAGIYPLNLQLVELIPFLFFGHTVPGVLL